MATQFPLCAGGKMMVTCPKEGMTHQLVHFHHTVPSSLTHLLFDPLLASVCVVSWHMLRLVSQVFDSIWCMNTCFNPDMRFVRTTPWRSVVWPLLMWAPTPAWQRTWWAKQRHRPHSPSTVRAITVTSLFHTVQLASFSFIAPWTAIQNSFPFWVTVQLDSNAI